MTTRPTLGSNKAVGNTLGAAEWNLNCLQQGNWTQEVLLGTNADKIPGTALASPLTLQGDLGIDNDANFTFSLAAGIAPRWTTASGSTFLQYNRSTTSWEWQTTGSVVFTIDSAGKLTGTGFYRSTEVTITNGNNANFAHGLAAKPYFVHGLWGTVTNNNFTQIDKAAGTVTFGNQDAVNINVANASGANAFVVVAVMK